MNFEIFTTMMFGLTVKMLTAFFLYQADKNFAYAFIVYESYKLYELFQRYMQLRSFLKTGSLEDVGGGVYVSKPKKDEKSEDNK